MCNINLAYNKQGIQIRRISEYMNAASWNSWQLNDDGEGYIGLSERGTEIGRSLRKLKYYEKYILLTTHQRRSTSGFSSSNIHPHSTENLILQHNGIFAGLGNKEKSDTREYIDMLEEEYVKNAKDILKAIQATTIKIGGSYSIIVYEKSTGKIYYYKENSTNMYLLKNKRWLVMSTSKSNVEFAQFYFGIGSKIKEVKPNIVYDVTDNFRAIGKFKEKEYEPPIHKSNYWFEGYRNCNNNSIGRREALQTLQVIEEDEQIGDPKLIETDENSLEARSKTAEYCQKSQKNSDEAGHKKIVMSDFKEYFI